LWITIILCLIPSKHLQAINGFEGTFEFACDAPWRIEPHRRPDGSIEYGAIPIQISIHDARETTLDNILFHRSPGRVDVISLPAQLVSLGAFRQVYIRQLDPPTSRPGDTYELAALHEIELTLGAWPWPSDPTEPVLTPAHHLCRVWAGEDPEPFRHLGETSEWHATLWHRPPNLVPGTTLLLEVNVVLERDPWPGLPVELDLRDRTIVLQNYVRVHLAADPLPRFDPDWLYGDCHYHSQGTDNEGESAYNYRGVARAMGAMGIDFLFATEHASSSDQLMDLDLNIDLLEEAPGGILNIDVDLLEEEDTDQIWGTLRDMNRLRYAFCHGLIHGNSGANREASLQGASGRFPQNYLSYGVVPQIFLGGEIDAIPELRLSSMGPAPPPDPGPPPSATDLAEYWAWLQRKEAYEAWRPYGFVYGNGLIFDLASMRNPGRQPLARLHEAAGDALLVRDFQGLDTYDLYGRGHLIYFPQTSQLVIETNIVVTYDFPPYYDEHPEALPDDGSLPPGTLTITEEIHESSFIASNTSKYGGATRRLDAWHQDRPPLLPEIEKKGVAFVAHHLNAGDGGRGPDGVPWTLDHMLLKAFRSPAILGLEFWNEDGRYETRICSHEFCRNDGLLGEERGFERDESFDIFGFEPAALSRTPLGLPEVREGFITGGLSGGEFSLIAFSLPDGRWEQESHDIEHALHHGARDWDRLNLMGLDLEGAASLPWLSPGWPRRVFMAGGSDAHGDLNYRRAGYFLGAENANDTALAKPRNLVLAGPPEGLVLADLNPEIDPEARGAHAADRARVRPPGLDPPVIDPPPIEPPEPPPVRPDPPVDPPTVGGIIRAHSQEQVVRALRNGRFSVTDGPAIRIAIDMNANHQIDDADLEMGDVYTYRKDLPSNAVHRDLVTVLVECISTPEFGPVTRLDLYVGVHPDGAGPGLEGRVYAADNHGARDPVRDPGSNPVFTYISQGQAYTRMADGYWLDPRLSRAAPTGNPFAFTWVTTLDVDHYEVGRGIAGDRFFLRAFARTGGDAAAQRPSRYAFTNPIWLLRDELHSSDLPIVITEVPRLASKPAVASERAPDGSLRIEFIGRLQHTPRLDRPFQDVPGAVSPHLVPARETVGFFRARE
jgi:hypothetical protein